MIITALWSLVVLGANAAETLAAKAIGGPPSWWPTGGYDSFTNGMSYLTYFFNFPACIIIVAASLSLDLAFMAARWIFRGVSLMTGGGGSF